MYKKFCNRKAWSLIFFLINNWTSSFEKLKTRKSKSQSQGKKALLYDKLAVTSPVI